MSTGTVTGPEHGPDHQVRALQGPAGPHAAPSSWVRARGPRSCRTWTVTSATDHTTTTPSAPAATPAGRQRAAPAAGREVHREHEQPDDGDAVQQHGETQRRDGRAAPGARGQHPGAAPEHGQHDPAAERRPTPPTASRRRRRPGWPPRGRPAPPRPTVRWRPPTAGSRVPRAGPAPRDPSPGGASAGPAPGASRHLGGRVAPHADRRHAASRPARSPPARRRRRPRAPAGRIDSDTPPTASRADQK